MGVATTGARMAHTLLADLDRHGKLDDRLRYEILAGELVIRGLPLVRHEHAVSVLVQHFRNWVTEHGGVAYAGAGIEIGDHQLRPDLTFMGPARVDEIDADGFHVAPDLVAEVTSPGTRSLDLHEKRAIYEAIGVGEYWVVDLAEQRVIVHRRDTQGGYQATEHTAGTLSTEQAPGLEVPVGEVLAST
ncbi:MAG: Uma2 family endonuclease [Egibacteraceae bacterium]